MHHHCAHYVYGKSPAYLDCMTQLVSYWSTRPGLRRSSRTTIYCSIGRSRNFEKGRRRKTSYQHSSSFIANARNELGAFYTEKTAYWKKFWANRGGGVGRPTPTPLNPPLLCSKWTSSENVHSLTQMLSLKQSSSMHHVLTRRFFGSRTSL